MADRYVMIGLATGNDDGTSWTDAYQSVAGFQTALDATAAGDTCHVASVSDADITLAAPMDIDTTQGTATSPCELVGYGYNGGSPTEDGTYVCLDCDSAALCGLKSADKDFWVVRNFEIKNSTGDCVEGATANPRSWIFNNCYLHDAAGAGIGDGAAAKPFDRCAFVYCRFEDNTTLGADAQYANYSFCTFIGNGTYGFNSGSYSVVYGSVIHGNTGDGGYTSIGGGIFDCVFDGNSDGIDLGNAGAAVIGCTQTNNGAYGIRCRGLAVVLYCLQNGNTSGAILETAPAYEELKGASTDVAGAEMYEDQANDKFTNRIGAPGFRNVLTLPDGLSKVSFGTGLPNVPILHPRG